MEGHLKRDALLQPLQQRVGQCPDACPICGVGVQLYPEHDADNQADTTERQTDAQKRTPPARSLSKRVNRDIDDLGGLGQRYLPSRLGTVISRAPCLA